MRKSIDQQVQSLCQYYVSEWAGDEHDVYESMLADVRFVIDQAKEAAYSRGVAAGAAAERERYKFDSTKKCPTCEGQGRVRTGLAYDKIEFCPWCAGSGNMALFHVVPPPDAPHAAPPAAPEPLVESVPALTLKQVNDLVEAGVNAIVALQTECLRMKHDNEYMCVVAREHDALLDTIKRGS
jgi:hypothetical protein